MQPQIERRTSRRFSLHLPILAKYPAEGEVWTHIRNISSRGVCFYASGGFIVGSVLEFILALPAELTFADPVRIAGTGKVVRLETNEHGTVAAIAATIQTYEFLVREKLLKPLQ